MTRFISTLAGIVLAVALAACSSTTAAPPSAPSVDAARATEIVEQALEAYNTGDYAGWTEHWDAAMKSAVSESAFEGVRDELMGSLGRYVSHGTPTLSSTTPETFRWTFPVTFEKASATFWVAFWNGSTEISGLRFE